jgi:hypothetical protein
MRSERNFHHRGDGPEFPPETAVARCTECMQVRAYSIMENGICMRCRYEEHRRRFPLRKRVEMLPIGNKPTTEHQVRPLTALPAGGGFLASPICPPRQEKGPGGLLR